MQGHRADTGRDVQACIALDGKRLQRDRTVEAAEQHMRADAYANSGAGRRTGIITLKGAVARAGSGGEHGPHDDSARGIADIDTELGDRSDIMLIAASVRKVTA